MTESNTGARSERDRQNVDELRDLIKKLEQAIQELRSNVESDELQSRVCLATRSAYTHLHALAKISKIFDVSAADELRCLTDAAYKTLPPGKYRESVESRCDDLDDFMADPATVCEEFDTAEV